MRWSRLRDCQYRPISVPAYHSVLITLQVGERSPGADQAFLVYVHNAGLTPFAAAKQLGLPEGGPWDDRLYNYFQKVLSPAHSLVHLTTLHSLHSCHCLRSVHCLTGLLPLVQTRHGAGLEMGGAQARGCHILCG